MAPLGQLVVACGRPIDAVLDAFRTGDGVPYADYGPDRHEGQARFTRPMFDQAAHQRVAAGRGGRARATAHRSAGSRRRRRLRRGTLQHDDRARLLNVRVDGIDVDAASIEAARRHLAGSGLEERRVPPA